MAQGVISTNAANFSTTEAAHFKTKLGMPVSLGGLIYNQYGASTSISNTTTATSLFNASATTAKGGLTIPAGALAWAGAPQAGIAYTNDPGCFMRIRLHGTTTCSSTTAVNLTVTMGLNLAGTYTAYSTSGAVAMATGSNGNFVLDLLMGVAIWGVAGTGQIVAGGRFDFAPTGTAGVTKASSFSLPFTRTTATFDSTQANIMDVQATWGTAETFQTLVMQYGTIEMLS